MKISTIISNKITTILSIFTLIITWKIISLIVNQQMILPSPEATFKSLIFLLKSKTFFKAVITTIGRGLLGFFLSCTLGAVVGILTGISSVIEKMLEPLLIIIKSTPVMSIIILALIWFETDYVPVFVSFLVAFPIICVNVSEGMKSVDGKIIQMAQIYGVKKWRILFEIYIPSITSFFVAGVSTAMGIGWKAVIAAEVLSQPKYAIGTSLYTSKIYIETESVFAWTVVAILLSFVFERVIRILEKKMIRWRM